MYAVPSVLKKTPDQEVDEPRKLIMHLARPADEYHVPAKYEIGCQSYGLRRALHRQSGLMVTYFCGGVPGSPALGASHSTARGRAYYKRGRVCQSPPYQWGLLGGGIHYQLCISQVYVDRPPPTIFLSPLS